ncbi:UNVERIFIED_CONTAM: Protein MAIN-LIKE 1 [Sesamum indicum]
MCILGGVLCPDATGNTVLLLYLRHMENIHEEYTSNWGSAVLAYLYRELCTASQRGKTNIGGAMQLLQIWAWSRIITLAPIPSSEASSLVPTIIDPDNILPSPPYAARWSYHISRTHTAHNALRIIRNVLDRMQLNEALPYYAMRTTWNIRCPLINYSLVEMHHPERVLRQFGYVQDIPQNPLISERRLHSIDRRGRQDMDWATFHADYIAKWNDVVVITVPDYMNWYHQITRVQISQNILSTNTPGYRPTDTRDWEYVYNRMEQLVIDCENVGDDQQSLRDTRARARTIGREIMNFSSSRYPSVRVRPTDTARDNAFTEAGPSSVHAETGPSTGRTEAGPSSFYPKAQKTSTLWHWRALLALYKAHVN